jgi:hypothetical protein
MDVELCSVVARLFMRKYICVTVELKPVVINSTFLVDVSHKIKRLFVTDVCKTCIEN